MFSMQEIIPILLISAAAIPLGILLGCGAIYVINHVPAAWLCDYGEEPSGDLLDSERQRVRGMPWKLVFSALFIALGIFFGTRDVTYGLTALLQLWLLLLIAISDMKYRIIPDQFVFFIALFAFPMSVYRAGVLDMLLGLLLGAGVLLTTALIGRILFSREALGFGDVKLAAALGLTGGLAGTAFLLIAASLLSCGAFLYLLLRRKVRHGDSLPLAPYLALAAAGYLFLQGAAL